MEDTEVEFFLCCEMAHTGDERPLERPVIGPFGKHSVDIGVVQCRLAMGVVRYGQALPRHPRIEDPQDEVQDAMIAQFALRTPLIAVFSWICYNYRVLDEVQSFGRFSGYPLPEKRRQEENAVNETWCP